YPSVHSIFRSRHVQASCDNNTGAISADFGGAARPRTYYVPLLQQVLSLPPPTGPSSSLMSPPPVQSQSLLQPASSLPGPSPYSGPTRGLTERRERESRLALPVSFPASPESRPMSPIFPICTGRCVPRQRPPPVLGTHSMTLRPSTAPQCVPLPSTSATSLPALADLESDSLRTTSLTVTRLLATAVTDPSFESTAASALVAELGDFAALCRHDYAASLVADSASVCPPSVEGFSTTFLQGILHEEIWLRRPPGFTGSFPAGTQWSLWRPVYGLRVAPCEWHDTLRMILAALGFAPSTADPSLFLRTDATLPLFYILVYVDGLVFATADTEALAHVKSKLQKRHTCTDLGELTSYLGLRITRDRAQRTITLTQSHMVQQVLQRFGFTYSSASVSWRSTHSSSVLSSSCEAEIYAGAMAAQELCSLSYLLTDLGEAPRSPPVLYVDNKAILALCQEHRLEQRTKHIALRYFLAQELQQRGQLRLAYVASRANTADVFTKAIQPCDHQRFCTVLGLVPTVPHLLTS
ncbi:unnamed protein product, partial [Closterium sp. NIES-54]